MKPPFPKSPAGIHKNPCAEGQCWTDCECGSRLASPKILNASVKASVATLQQVGTKKNPCGEDLPCDGACECSTSILLSLISPDTPMASLPRVCGPQECSADCICRDDLIKTAKVVASLKEHDSKYEFLYLRASTRTNCGVAPVPRLPTKRLLPVRANCKWCTISSSLAWNRSLRCNTAHSVRI